MINKKREFFKLLGLSFLSVVILPYKLLYSTAKKIINQDLSDEQKDIMFNEATERPYSSPLNNEKRNGFFHCANCGAKLFSSKAKFDSGTGWPSFTESLPGAFNTKIIIRSLTPRDAQAREVHTLYCVWVQLYRPSTPQIPALKNILI